MAERRPWAEVVELVAKGQAAALRRDPAGVRASVALVPATQLRRALVALLEAWAVAVIARHPDPAAVGRLLAEDFDPQGGGESG